MIPYILISFDDQGLFMALLIKQGGRFYVKQNERVTFACYQVYKGRLFNVTLVHTYLHHFLRKNNIKNPFAIICLPERKSLACISYPEILQVAICFAKSGIKPYKIISQEIFSGKEDVMKDIRSFSKQDIDDQLNYFKLVYPEASTRLFFWLGASLLVCALLSSTLTLIHFYQTESLKALAYQRDHLVRNIEDLKDKMHAHQLLEESNHTINNHMKNVCQLKKNTNEPVTKFLRTLSVRINTQASLVRINIAPIDSFQLSVQTLQDREVLRFKKQLEQLTMVARVKLEKIQKVDRLTTFMVSGKLAKSVSSEKA